jgi:hypothetical protein
VGTRGRQGMGPWLCCGGQLCTSLADLVTGVSRLRSERPLLDPVAYQSGVVAVRGVPVLEVVLSEVHP